MSLAFKELAGSPVENFGPDGFRAERVLVCGWEDRRTLIEQLLGDGYDLGGRRRAVYPDNADLVALRVRCEPLADDLVAQTLADVSEGLNRYQSFAKITVQYEALAQSTRSSLPATEPGTVLAYQQQYRGDSLRLAGHSLAWDGQAGVPVPPESIPSLQAPIIEHRLAWHRVLSPPWDVMRQAIGTVNRDPFLGAPAGTVLLAGAAAQQEFVRTSSLSSAEQAWRIDYLFWERALKTPSGAIVGWNHAYRSLPAGTPGWSELVDPAGHRLYVAADFAPLLKFAELLS